MNDTATHFLQTYAAAGEVDGGWMYGKALQQARLDYSPESLVRLDTLLQQARERAQPAPADLDSAKGRNFMSLIAYYVIEIARRLSRVEITWTDRATALRELPGMTLPDVPATRLLADAQDRGRLYQPLAWLEAQLLPGGPSIKAGDYIANLVLQLESEGPAEWWHAAYALGRLGASQMMMAANNFAVWPRMVGQNAPDTLVQMPEGDLHKALATADHVLTANPDKALWQVLSYAGYHEVNGARLDAVIVLSATYGEKPGRMKVAFPFRPARDGRRFAILQPALVEANLTVETVGKFNSAMERGIRGHVWAEAGSWAEFYEGQA